MKASKKRGFTIVELIIVIAVIAILAAVLIPTFSNLISRVGRYPSGKKHEHVLGNGKIYGRRKFYSRRVRCL